MKEFMRFVSVDVGDTICAHAYGVRKKEIIPAVISAAAAIGSAVYSGIESKKEKDKAERTQSAKEASQNAWYKYNHSGALDESDLAVIRKAQDLKEEDYNRIRGRAAVGGATDAAVAQQKEIDNKNYADTVMGVHANKVSQKINAENVHHTDMTNNYDTRMKMAETNAANVASVGGQVSDAIMKAGTAYDSFNSGSTASNVKDSTGTLGNASKGIKVDYNSIWK